MHEGRALLCLAMEFSDEANMHRRQLITVERPRAVSLYLAAMFEF